MITFSTALEGKELSRNFIADLSSDLQKKLRIQTDAEILLMLRNYFYGKQSDLSQTANELLEHVMHSRGQLLSPGNMKLAFLRPIILKKKLGLYDVSAVFEKETKLFAYSEMEGRRLTNFNAIREWVEKRGFRFRIRKLKDGTRVFRKADFDSIAHAIMLNTNKDYTGSRFEKETVNISEGQFAFGRHPFWNMRKVNSLTTLQKAFDILNKVIYDDIDEYASNWFMTHGRQKVDKRSAKRHTEKWMRSRGIV